jgi:hypothetical protein
MGMLAKWLGLGDSRRDLLSDLLVAYAAEATQASQLRHQAGQARYRQVAEVLEGLAATEDRHAGWLRDRILALGGEIPPVAPLPLRGRNQWERVVAAHRAATTKRKRIVDLVSRWDPERPDEVAVLTRVEREDGRDLELYEGIVMRSDPQSLD